MSFSDRLREERNRVGFIQADAAKAAGVGFTSYQGYERGDRVPNADALNGLHLAGFDVLYLVTGVRNKATLSDEDSSILADLNQVDEKGRTLAITTMRSLLDTYRHLS
ncbi:helix-turn-helix domain-containing protein [Chromobacterium vaccinii]|uniref:helix-turn-helix domain-containing protein n=1 Tax=Chromobacterium vaccinii TaxID=1108595 RepID=UPI003C719295